MEQSSDGADRQRAGSCGECRWVGLWPQPYGSTEYFCERRQEVMSSAVIDRRRCGEFER